MLLSLVIEISPVAIVKCQDINFKPHTTPPYSLYFIPPPEGEELFPLNLIGYWVGGWIKEEENNDDGMTLIFVSSFSNFGIIIHPLSFLFWTW